MKVVPVPKALPPEAFAYHLIVVPADPVAPAVAVPVPQRKPGVVETTELLNPIVAALE